MSNAWRAKGLMAVLLVLTTSVACELLVTGSITPSGPDAAPDTSTMDGTTEDAPAQDAPTDAGIDQDSRAPRDANADAPCTLNTSLHQSCKGGLACGPVDASCCMADYIEGGSFVLGAYRDAGLIQGTGAYVANPEAGDTADASVGAFLLDRYEVTLGRFSAFYEAVVVPGCVPPVGSGQEPHLEGGTASTGWISNYDTAITSAQIKDGLGEVTEAGLVCQWQMPTPTVSSLPIDCVSWAAAQAFCIWDGGRLPTEAQWVFAAMGGAKQLLYPWGGFPPVVKTQLDDTIDPVGMWPAGQGPFGSYDLAGNVLEWVFDPHVSGYPNPCEDCVQPMASTLRVVHGGDANVAGKPALLANVTHTGTQHSAPELGFRCAYDP
jgi:formylglycine-generating enzyme